jgi:dipeptide transport system ATP-binding protein
MKPVLIARDLQRHYRISRGLFRGDAILHALNGVSLQLAPGQTLAIVGESGCGKSTLARLLSLIETPDAGSLQIDGIELQNASRGELKQLRQRVQMVFQNPLASLNPKRSIGAQLEEPLRINTRLSAGERREKVAAMLTSVGLRPEHAGRYPHMFSGGQRQRIAIARAMMLNPKVVIADEPTSALDVSVQAQVLNLFADLQQEFGTAYVFISHNLAAVRQIADQLLVMYLGRVVEQGPAEQIYQQPLHPYTRVLLAATPLLGTTAAREVLQGEAPNPLAPPGGCPFHPRCPWAQARCREQNPPLRPLQGREVACHRAEEIAAQG